jgi:hypothetical protein
MGRAQPDIHGLIEEGLTRYSRGDLDGALRSWEQVLEQDPHHEQALGYIDYLRMSYRLLVSGVGGPAEPPPFAIAGDDPEYRIQAAPGELAVGSVAPRSGAVRDGWAIEEEAPESGRIPMKQLTFTVGPGQTERTGLSFEDATAEYAGPGRRSAPLVADEGVSQEFRLENTPTPGFEPEQQTPGFGTQLTDVRPRHLGFVQSATPAAAPARELGHRRASTTQTEPPTLRIPNTASGSTPALPVPRASEPPERDSPSSYDPDPPTIERSPSDASRADLMASFPTRRVPHAPSATGTGTKPAPPAHGDALDFDSPTERKDPPVSRPGSRPGSPLSMIADLNPVISASTRELGLRPGGAARAATEDEPTGLAEGSAHSTAAARTEPAPTRSDIVLPFDPIDARSTQILDAIDRRVPPPPDEPQEDRTRRRIAALFEHATEWSKAGELDRAVAAIDLALSEDPNSALAQRLIQRNRDTITNVFQSFLGDLNRTPILARPLHELADAPISPRAAFLLSRVDGLLSIDEILDVSGMPRIEAYRYLCQLFLRGILR